ncbi:hypothetical protein DIC66_22440 [Rhodoferax lacus]|uniref:Uncharacterized protein n=1 Tax=Rhodoferax lacus TaxID=2184758 RepID=A0A3E1R5I7_9BURK|nr:hypothetical protein DIC66_22440 [Rhodoferax lacus]
MSNRYRLPDKAKECQAEELKRRFARSWGARAGRRHGRAWLVFVLCALVWLVVHFLRKFQGLQ